MERIWMKNWPQGVSTRIAYRLGEKPLHEYVHQNSKDFPNKPAYIFYGRELSCVSYTTLRSASPIT